MKFNVSASALFGGLLFIIISMPAFAENLGNPASFPSNKDDSQEKYKQTLVVKQQTNRIITLDEAIHLAISQNPRLAAAAHEMEGRKAAAQQAAVLPNPELIAEIEEFGGSGDFSGNDAMASRIGISQEILLGGKLSKRKQLAAEENKLVMFEREAQVIALSTEVSKRFLEVYIAQEKLKLAENDLQLTQVSADVISKRVASGEASPLEETKFAVETAAAATTVKRMARIVDAARLSLAATWGGSAPDFAGIAGDFFAEPSLQNKDQLLERLDKSPTYRLLTEQVVLAENKLRLAKAEAVPDMEIGGGIQQFEETNDHAYFLEVSIPLPFFDRNKGGIAEARALLNKTKKEKEAGGLELQTSLSATMYELEGVWENYLSMRDTIVPVSEKAFASVQKAYRLGEQDYLDLLEAQRSLLKARNEHLELLAELWQLKLEADSLVGYTLVNEQI